MSGGVHGILKHEIRNVRGSTWYLETRGKECPGEYMVS
jgi:hypothetical protein